MSETGTGQGQTVSPLLANVYLHYVLDEWFENEVKPRLNGAAHEIRFADDAVLRFEYREDAEKVMEVLPKRFAKYGLTLHPEKTRLVDFGRYAEELAKRQGKKPATFDFLGFTHICARSRRGRCYPIADAPGQILAAHYGDSPSVHPFSAFVRPANVEGSTYLLQPSLLRFEINE